MAEFRMPALGADMDAGTLVEWLKHPGDTVSRGDIIAVVDTQKGAIDVEVFEDGTLERVLVEPGTTVPVGTVLATIRGRGEPASPTLGSSNETRPAEAAPSAAATPPPSPVAATPEASRSAGAEVPPSSRGIAPGAATASAGPTHPRMSPLARKIAEERGIDPSRIVGTGPQGAITREDVERVATARESGVSEGRARMRAAIASAVARSKREIPHYYLSTDIDVGTALEWLAARNAARSVTDRVLPVALLVKAVARALATVPELNGHWLHDGFRQAASVHVGCAVALRGGGLIAPAIHETASLDLEGVMKAIADVTARARAGSLRSSELSDATITVTNLGDQGVDAAFGVIQPPQVAIVGFGRIRLRPWVREGAVSPRPVVTATLSADHRVSDGHRGGLFLSTVERLLQTPETL